MVPTNSQVKDLARKLLGDTEVSGGQVFTNTYLEDAVQAAYAELFRILTSFENPAIQGKMFANLPANQNFLDPADVGVTNFGEPIEVRERGSATTSNIAGVTPATGGGCRININSHPFDTGDVVVVIGPVGGISDDIMDEWSITKVDANNFDLNGCTSTGTYTSGGKVSKSTEDWSRPIRPVDDLISFGQDTVSRIDVYSWYRDKFRFIPTDTERQIRVKYTPSGKAPTGDSDSLFFDDSKEFLAYAAAAVAASWNGATELADRLEHRAFGPPVGSGQIRAGGLIGQLVNLGMRTLSQKVFRPRPYRPRRNTGLPGRFIY